MFRNSYSKPSASLRVGALLIAAIVALLAPGTQRSLAAGTSLSVVHRFPTNDNSGYRPAGGLIEASDGNFYGTTRYGGGMACGTVYRLTGAGVFMQLHVFGDDPGQGCEPAGRLLEGLDGKLYGTTRAGTSSLGIVYRMALDGSDFEVIAQFSNPQGSSPIGSLVQGADGTLYGTTSGGGANGNGTVFKLASDGSGFTALHSFAVASSTTTTSAGLLLASDGNLYGTLASSAGSDGGGVFRIATSGAGYTLIHQYAGNPGGIQSEAPLIEGSDGLLYGVGKRYAVGGSCGSGCVFYNTTQVAFSMAKDGSSKTEIHTFTDASPIGGLLLASDGNLYGLVFAGAYRLAINGTGYTLLHTFGTGNDGDRPVGDLIQAANGTLYGATQLGGGTSDAGVVFSLTTAGVEAVFHTFGTQSDGFIPVAGVIIGGDGLLYGATYQGGSPYFQDDPTGARGSEGAVYKLATDGSGFALLHSFTFANSDAAHPLGTPIQGLDGALYGTTTNGGAISSAGAVYRVPTDGNPETLVHSFQFCAPCNEGFHPSTGVIQSPIDGTLYGVSDFGGTGDSFNGRGLIYKVQPNGTGYSALRSFLGGSADGAYPKGAVTLAADGRLYGTASRGGSMNCLAGAGCGTIFGIDTDGTGYTTLRAFQGGDDGAVPAASLLEGSDGYLYGTTSEGGGGGCDGTGCGTVFRILPDGSDYAVLHAFTGGEDGATTVAGLAEAADGTLYGTTRYGGGNECGGGGCGTIFRIAPSGAYAVAHRFVSLADGAHPRAALTLAGDGSFFGTASRGGSVLDGGTVFHLQDTPTFLPAPTGLMATAADAQVTLSWTVSAGATSYSVYRGTTTGGQSAVAVASGIAGTSTVVTGLANGTEYFFVVKGANGADRSPASAEASATPVAAPVVTFSVAPAAITVGQSATLTWTSTGASACTASGDWSGAQPLSGSTSVTPTAAGTLSYVLICTGTGGTTARTANLTVTTPSSGGGGGGAQNVLGSLALSLLAFARRRRAR